MKRDASTLRQIRANPAPRCYLCGSEGNTVYQNQRDKLFEAPGIWNFKLCSNVECELMWLDPMPIEQDIGKAYEKYYTHAEITIPKQEPTKALTDIWRKWVFPVLSFASPFRRERERLSLMYLGDSKPGRLLDVGCGNALRLARLRALGWDVYGQDVDPEAVAYARNTFQIEVHLGRLEDSGFPEMSFDYVILHHVIEHVHDPVKLLKECRRLLKRGGLLVVVTPNTRSFGRKHFGGFWRGLEPPRHIYLFSSKALSTIAVRAGLTVYRAWTTAVNASTFAYGSLLIRRGAYPSSKLRTKLYCHIYAGAYQFRSICQHIRDTDSGEECVLQATN
jgi:2-polyprenyl-3-methyl-5-hydroxy-6-metoxy-1,4-benzoquinol methylase